jgi:DNA-directed RNA polymerase specialized sigma24 family protein
MLGSVADAEDLVQETFLRWQEADRAEVKSPRAFLSTIITRLSINHLRSARTQREQLTQQFLFVNRRPISVLVLDIVDHRVQTIYIVSNPEKLAAMPSPSSPVVGRP